MQGGPTEQTEHAAGQTTAPDTPGEESAANKQQAEEDIPELVSESEYKTATEFIPEFQSDNEPPEDRVAETRMIYKTQKLRVYKKILRVGRGNYMPAKYDRVTFKHVETEIESLNARDLEGATTEVGQLGIDIQDEELVCCLSNMKEAELSTFTIERVTYTEKKKRILESSRYMLAEMNGWDTIIDMFGDMQCMKNISTRGVGQRRYNLQDEVSFSAKVYQQDNNLLWEATVDRKFLKDISQQPCPVSVKEVLLSSKVKERSTTRFTWDWVQENEKDESLVSKLVPDLPLVVEVEVHQIVEVMDLFANGSVFKKVTKFSYSTAAPDENSCIFFDYMVFDKENNLIHSTCKSFLQLMPTQDDIPSMKERGTPFCFLDEYEYSSALRKALSVGKKLEEFDLVINGPDKYRYGADWSKTKKILGSLEETHFPLTLKVKMYFFSCGENCYSMRLNQKIAYCEVKKPKTAALLKQGDYGKALKMIGHVREMVERRDQKSMSAEEQAEEIEGLKTHRKSALLNLTLCQWRLGLWKELIRTCALILTEIDPSNGKILYRQCCGYMAQKDYHVVSLKYKEFVKSFPQATADYPELDVLAQEAQAKEKAVSQKERAMYSKMAAAFGGADS